MPRARKNNRGGPRAGQRGRAYPNRSDLNAQPVRTVPGQTYGEAGQQAAAQAQIPLPATQPITGQPVGPGAPAPLEQAVPLLAPSDRPDEPLTAGAPVGPGPGPEAVGLLGQPDHTADLLAMAPYMPVLEYMVSQPDASPTTRNWVRRLRGALPAGQ